MGVFEDLFLGLNVRHDVYLACPKAGEGDSWQ